MGAADRPLERMSFRDDTSRHEGVHPRRRRFPLVARIALIAVILAIAVTAVAWRRERATGWLELAELRAAADEGYVYLLLRTEGSDAPDWERVLYRIAIDTYDEKRGERRLPAPYDAAIPSGAEFLVDLGGPEMSAISVTPSYDPFPLRGEAVEGQPIVSPEKPSGRFVKMEMRVNRPRFARDGRRFDPIVVERGRLRFLGAREDARVVAQADVATGPDGAIEIRIPWSLLNVSDPSSHRVLHGTSRSEDSETTQTKGFRIYAYSFDRARIRSPLADQLPGSWTDAALFTWAGWEEPKYRLEPKRGASVIARTMQDLAAAPLE
jgi:hypothetical protein